MIEAAQACAALALAVACGGAARADFALNNMRHILYHEVGHAVIDQLDVALFGPEETAADGFAMVLADRLHGEEALGAIVSDHVRLARIEAERGAFDPWHEYMPGSQRLAWAICLYYGLEPERRGDLARALGLPPTREGACEKAGDRARAAWAPVFDRMAASAGSRPTLRPVGGGKAMRVLADAIEALDPVIVLPLPVTIEVERCGQDNAFYYVGDTRIAFCAELFHALDAVR